MTIKQRAVDFAAGLGIVWPPHVQRIQQLLIAERLHAFEDAAKLCGECNGTGRRLSRAVEFAGPKIPIPKDYAKGIDCYACKQIRAACMPGKPRGAETIGQSSRS